MRASRAYIAGFGTTSVLVSSVLLLLAVVSAIVAFETWPHTGISEDIRSLVVNEPDREDVESPLQVALNAPSAAAAVAGSPTPGTAAAGGASAPGAVARRAPSLEVPLPPDRDGGANLRDLDPAPTGPVANSPPSSPLAEALSGGILPDTPLSPRVNRLTENLGYTTQGLTDGLGGTVGRINPQLGQTVTNTGRLLSELLRGLGRPRR